MQRVLRGTAEVAMTKRARFDELFRTHRERSHIQTENTVEIRCMHLT